MKRMLLPPIFVLAALLAFSLWNIRHMEGETDRWREQLQAGGPAGPLRGVGRGAGRPLGKLR